MPFGKAAAGALVPELVDPVRRRPARRHHDPMESWMPPPAPRPTAYGDVQAPATGLLIDVYG